MIIHTNVMISLFSYQINQNLVCYNNVAENIFFNTFVIHVIWSDEYIYTRDDSTVQFSDNSKSGVL